MLYDQTVTVVPHGSLTKYMPEPITMTGTTVQEIMNGVTKAVVGFKKDINREPIGITVRGFDTPQSLVEGLPHGTKELHLYPAMVGGKKGFFKVVLGGIFIAASILFAPAGVGLLGIMAGQGGILASLAFSAGVSLALGGLAEIISPAPRMDTSGGVAGNSAAADPEASKYLGANQNTVRVGTRIPLLYGTYIAYGHYISLDIGAVDVSTTANNNDVLEYAMDLNRYYHEREPLPGGLGGMLYKMFAYAAQGTFQPVLIHPNLPEPHKTTLGNYNTSLGST